jgi:hypothetical protein
VPPHNLNRDWIEASIASGSFQVWRASLAGVYSIKSRGVQQFR